MVVVWHIFNCSCQRHNPNEENRNQILSHYDFVQHFSKIKIIQCHLIIIAHVVVIVAVIAFVVDVVRSSASRCKLKVFGDHYAESSFTILRRSMQFELETDSIKRKNWNRFNKTGKKQNSLIVVIHIILGRAGVSTNDVTHIFVFLINYPMS